MRAHAFLVLVAFSIGCSESHGSGDAAVMDSGGRDAAPHDARAALDAPRDDCPPIGAPRCVDETCCGEEAAAVLEPGCHFVCPSGFVVADTCEPSASCSFEGPCTTPSECTLAANDCCGPCGTPTLDDYDAILTSRAAAHQHAVCPAPDPACPDCVVMDDPNLGATCNAGRCEEYDVRQLPLSACTSDDACVLRTRDCCECGASTDPTNLVAIRGDARVEYASLLCDDLGACPPCEPIYPTDVEAYCADDGHCAIRAVP